MIEAAEWKRQSDCRVQRHATWNGKPIAYSLFRRPFSGANFGGQLSNGSARRTSWKRAREPAILSDRRFWVFQFYQLSKAAKSESARFERAAIGRLDTGRTHPRHIPAFITTIARQTAARNHKAYSSTRLFALGLCIMKQVSPRGALI